MYEEGYVVLKKQADNFIPSDYYKSLCGIKIIIKDYIEGVERNECRILFTDGTFKIIPIFEII